MEERWRKHLGWEKMLRGRWKDTRLRNRGTVLRFECLSPASLWWHCDCAEDRCKFQETFTHVYSPGEGCCNLWLSSQEGQ